MKCASVKNRINDYPGCLDVIQLVEYSNIMRTLFKNPCDGSSIEEKLSAIVSSVEGTVELLE